MRKLTASVSPLTLTIVPLVLFSALPAYGKSVDEITVTVRKTTESIQEVPMSITAIGAEQIDRQGIKGLDDLAGQDTSVQFDQGFSPSDTRVTIRGLSPTRGRPNAATLIDGIDISSEAVSNAGGSTLIDPRLIDVQRIEIVKGPQSALYGRSAFAGAIQYVTKDPDDQLGAELFVDYNLEGDEELRGNVSIPLSETLGLRINGLTWREDGYYKNAATGGDLGGGEGSGITATFKWEPSDRFSAKWRTDYADDHFDVAPQALLHDFNTIFDLGDSGGLAPSVSNLAPITNACNPVPGPLGSYDCGPGYILDGYLRDEPGRGPSSSLIYGAFNPMGYPQGFGLYDVNDDWIRNIYNQQVVSMFVGRIPDADKLQAVLQPDYRRTANPLDATDFEGTNRRVFRNSLVFQFDISDSLIFNSYTGFTDAQENTEQDIGKYYVDNCRPLISPGAIGDQSGNIEPLRQQNDCTAGDGIHDGGTTFYQDSENTTKQFSQEFRLAWDITDSVTFTQGLQFWRERVKQLQYNQTTVTDTAFCFLSMNNPAIGAPYDFAYGPLGPNYQCGLTTVPAAYFASKTFAAFEEPNELRRGTNHYSWYGNIKWNVTEQFRTTFEARFSREDNSVTGASMHPCVNALSDDFINNPDNPDKGTVSEFRDAYTGFPLCDGYLTNPLDGGAYWNAPSATNAPATSLILDPMSPDWTGGPMSGRIDGPGSVIACGFTGRCDRLEFVAGGSPGNPGSFSRFGFGTAGSFQQTLNRKDRYWAPKLTLEYFWNDDIMTYFSWSRGIKPGGFSLLTAGAFGLDANADGVYEEIEYEPERLDVWELGAKSTLFNGKLRLNGAVFYQDFKDKQVTVQEITASTTGTRVRNISGSEVTGLELDAVWQATDNLRVAAGYTFLDSEYTDYEVPTRSANDIARVQYGNGQGCVRLVTAANGDVFCISSFNGNDLERVPKHALNVNANYTNNLFDTGLEWFGEVNFQYQDSRWVEAFNIVEFPAYSRTNVSLGVLADVWDVQFYVTNVFDDDTVISGGPNPGIPTALWRLGLVSDSTGTYSGAVAGPKLPSEAYANLPAPRILGVRFNIRFGQ